jgi:hypothetical protein
MVEDLPVVRKNIFVQNDHQDEMFEHQAEKLAIWNFSAQVRLKVLRLVSTATNFVYLFKFFSKKSNAQPYTPSIS